MALASGHSAADQRVEQALGQVLRAGVVLSVLITLCGACLLLMQHRGLSGKQLIAEQAHARPAAAIFAGAVHGDGAGIILLGLLVLLLTPVFRVASMIVAFLWEKDWLYAAISLTVLCILLLGILLAK